MGKDNVKFSTEEKECKGKHILIVEDIYDTGHTMKKIIDSILAFGAKDVKTCVLLHKKNIENV